MNAVRPTVLFVCVHNAGRSQMAAGWLEHLAGDRIEVLSAGSEPADQINPIAVDVDGARSASTSPAARRRSSPPTPSATSDVVITMGCGDTCPFFPGKRYEDWDLADPAGPPIEVVREVRDEIRDRVESLVRELLPEG